MKTTIALCSLLLAGSLMAGCCGSRKEHSCSGTEAAASGRAETGTVIPKKSLTKAVTPAGDVLWIVEVWGELPAGKETCGSRRIWKTKDGKNYCADAVRVCPKKGKGCPALAHMKCKDGKIVCPKTDGKDHGTLGKKHWAVKEVKPCAHGGKEPCPTKDHVKVPGCEGPACAPKADEKVRKETAAGKTPELGDKVTEDAVFLVVTD